MGLLSPANKSGGALTLDSFMAKLSSRESSGKYSALGPVISNPKSSYYGDRAYGKYQVMGKNVPAWTKQYLGKSLTPQQFLSDTNAQDTLMRKRFDQLYKQYGNWDDVASVHFSGQPLAKAANRQDQLGTSTASYVRDITGGGVGSSGLLSRSSGGSVVGNAGLLKDYKPTTQPGVQPMSLSTFLPNWMTTQTSTPMVAQPGSGGGLLGLGQSVVQGFFRGTAAAGAGIAGIPEQISALAQNRPVKPGTGQFDPNLVFPSDDTFLGQLGRNLYGATDNKPISLQSTGEEIPGVSQGSMFAPLIGGTLSALDLVGAGSGAKGLLGLTRTLKAVNNAGDAYQALKLAGFADDLAKNAAPTFAKLTDAAEIERGLLKLQDLQNSTLKGGTAAQKGSAGLLGSTERGFITSVKNYAPELTARVAGQYIPRSTDTLAATAREFIKRDINAAETLARTGTSDRAVATAAELVKNYTTRARAARDAATANTFFDKAADIANVVARTLTEQGRAVQAASILGRLTPEGVVRFAAREIQKFNEGIETSVKGGDKWGASLRRKVPELSGEQVKIITDTAKNIENMADGVEKAMAWHKLMDDLGKLTPSPLWQKIISVWKAGLLTGVKTSGLNIASNLFHGVSEIIKDVPAAAVDSIASLFTGKRTLALTMRGTGSGTMEGVQKGWRYLRTGFDERDIMGKLDLKKVNFGTGPIARGIQAYEETIFKIIGSEDQPFYYGAKARSMASQAAATVKNEGLRGDAAVARARELIQNPTDDMLRYATLDAETAVFQNKTALARVGKGIQNIPGGELVVPFSKTPSAVAMQVINYSPAGFIKAFVENIGRGRFDQRIFSQQIGRATVGTGVMYAGYKLFEAGRISLGSPTTETEKKQWEAEGRKPNSILIDGKWRGLNTLGPAGFTMILGGYLAQGVQDTGSITQGVLQMAAGLPKTLTDQTFLRGLSDFVDAVVDPVRNAKPYFTGLVASIVPTLVSDVARANDPLERRTNLPGFGESVAANVKSRIPGARNTLEPQVNIFGEEKEAANPLEIMVDPSRPLKANNDPLALELRRLWDTDATNGTRRATPTQDSDNNGFDILTPAQNTALWKRQGELFADKSRKLIELDRYKELEDEKKVKILNEFADKAKLIGRVEMVLSLTQGLTGEALKTELSRLKAGGILTKEVLGKYAEMR